MRIAFLEIITLKNKLIGFYKPVKDSYIGNTRFSLLVFMSLSRVE